MTQHPDTDHKPYPGDRYDRLRACAEDYASGTNFGDNFIDGDMVKALAVNLTTARVLDGLTDHDANTVAMLTILDFPRGIVHMIWRLKDWTSENRSVDIRDDDEFAVVSVLARVLAIVCAAFVDEEFEIAEQHCLPDDGDEPIPVDSSDVDLAQVELDWGPVFAADLAGKQAAAADEIEASE